MNSMINKPFRGTLHEWELIKFKNKEVIIGLLDDGSDLRTSYLVSWNGDLVETRNSVYRLGKRCRVAGKD